MFNTYKQFVHKTLQKEYMNIYDSQLITETECDNLKIRRDISQFNIHYVIVDDNSHLMLCLVIKKDFIKISDLADLCFLLCEKICTGVIIYDGILDNKLLQNNSLLFINLKEPAQEIIRPTIYVPRKIPIDDNLDNISTTCDIDTKDIDYHLEDKGFISSTMCYVIGKVCNLAISASTGKN